jgi:chloramphenicol 3-O phosphotransferase
MKYTSRICSLSMLLMVCLSTKAINQQTNKIIIINGSSSAGKSSLVKAMQQLNETPLLTTGIDLLWDIIPPQYINDGEKADEGFCFIHTSDENGKPVIVIKIGSFLQSLQPVRSALIKSLMSTGYDVIVEEAFIEETIVHHYAEALQDYTVYFIGVMCDLDELERREKSRGDREIGLARWQIHVVHKYGAYYDYVIDTTNQSSSACAEQILAYINNHPRPTGFKQLRSLQKN